MMDQGVVFLAMWQFGSAGMLLWGLAAALPLLIHLLSRRQYRQEPWAAMSFLVAALRKNARWIQLQQWLLLAVRTAILLLFALALADPQTTSTDAAAGGAAAGPAHAVFVLDVSYSMGLRDGETTRFDAAKTLIREMVLQRPQQTACTLMVMGEPPRVVTSEPVYDADTFLNELDSLSLSHGGASLPATLAELEAVLRRAIQRHPRLVEQRAYFLTDLQQVTWGDVTSPDSRERLGRLAKLASLELIDLGQSGDSNLAVTSVAASPPLIVAGSEVQIQAEIQSFAREERPRQAVEMIVEGQRIADERIDLPAGSRVSVAAKHRFDVAGDHIVEVHLADDRLPLDNRRWLSIPVRQAIRALCIGSRPGDFRHIRLALAPEKQSTGPIIVSEAPESRLLDEDLSQFDCLFLSNIGRFSSDEAAVLHGFVSQGGGLVVFLGDQVQAASYNQLLVEDPGRRVLPARLGEAAPSSSTGYKVDPLDYQHPIVAPFRGFVPAGLLTTPIWKYVQLSPIGEAKTALALTNGDPLIVECRIGRGRSILVATAASSDSLDRSTDPPTPWTALSSWPSFPPLVHEMLRLTLTGQAEVRNVVVGDALTGIVRDLPPPTAVQLAGPGASEQLPVMIDGDEASWSFPGPAQSGVYEARAGSQTSRYAVNLNPRESDLARFDPGMLPSPLLRGPIDTSQAAPQIGSGRSYFRWLLGGVLILLLIEPSLAWYFRRGAD